MRTLNIVLSNGPHCGDGNIVSLWTFIICAIINSVIHKCVGLNKEQQKIEHCKIVHFVYKSALNLQQYSKIVISSLHQRLHCNVKNVCLISSDPDLSKDSKPKKFSRQDVDHCVSRCVMGNRSAIFWNNFSLYSPSIS